MSSELTQGSGNSVNAGVAVAVDARSRQLAGLRPWTPGTSGNPSGRPKGLFTKRGRKHLRIQVAADVDQADCVVDSIIQKAIAGDVSAATFLRDVVDGKPGPADGNNGPTNITVEIALVGGQ